MLNSPSIHPMFHSCTSLRYMTGQATCGGVVPLHFQLRDSRSCAIATEVCHRPKRDENSEEDPAQLGVLKRQAHEKRGSLHSFTNRSSRRCFALFSHIQKMQQFHLLHLFRLYLHDQKRFRLSAVPFAIFLSQTHLVVVSSPGGINSMMCRHPTTSCAFGSGQRNLWQSNLNLNRRCHFIITYDVSSTEVCFCDYSRGGSKIWQTLFFQKSRGVGCAFFLQHCWKTACIHQDRLVLVVLRQSTKSC